MKRKAGYAVQDDAEGLYVVWKGRQTTGVEYDESFPVYLPSGPRIRARAAQVIADALNAAGIPRARNRAKRE